jgi:hypothetical protein
MGRWFCCLLHESVADSQRSTRNEAILNSGDRDSEDVRTSFPVILRILEVQS